MRVTVTDEGHGGYDMERNILFVSRYPEIVQEFTDAMKDKDIKIDTALNGVEAAMCVKKKEYQVVITGLTLDGYNGEQIISYLNKIHPNTVCIIYTTTISPAQLHFFINQRDVYKVFLRPVDFRKEFYEALEEAFEYYDLRAKEQQEWKEQEQYVVEVRKKHELLTRKMRAQKEAQDDMNRYMKRFMAATVDAYATELADEQRKQLRGVEREMVDLVCGLNGNVEANFKKAESALKNIKEIAGIS